MLKDGVFWTVGVLNAEIHPKIHSIISFLPSLLNSSLFIIVLGIFFGMLIFLVWGVSLSIYGQKMRDLNVGLFGLGCFFIGFWAKRERFVGDIWDCPSCWDHCNCSLIKKFGESKRRTDL